MKEIIIVTGASSGMGREFAMQIEKKYQVDEIWVIARRKERLECLKEKLQTKVKIFALDLTQKESFEIIQEALFQEKPRVKALINCSGYGKLDHYENMSSETIENMMNLNMLAVVKMVNTVLPYMNKESHIVNFSCIGYKPEVILHALEEKDILISTRSACSSKTSDVSRVMQQLHLPDEVAKSALRVSISDLTKEEEIDKFIYCLKEVLDSIKKQR